MRLKRFIFLLTIIATSGCSTFYRQDPPPPTAGDPSNAPVFGYHPLDPLPVAVVSMRDVPITFERLLGVLPDETMRLAIASADASGNLSFGPAKLGVAGNSYVVILDYVKFQTQSLAVKLSIDGKQIRLSNKGEDADAIVPVYVGVGVRLTANIFVREGSVDLGNLFALGAAAQARQVTGTLVVQTLGLSGSNISPLVPMPSEINPTTIQNAIMALGAIKAKIYDAGTASTPRVVGVYNTLGGGQQRINSFISSLLDRPREVTLP